jgi:hypothetical protein
MTAKQRISMNTNQLAKMKAYSKAKHNSKAKHSSKAKRNLQR